MERWGWNSTQKPKMKSKGTVFLILRSTTFEFGMGKRGLLVLVVAKEGVFGILRYPLYLRRGSVLKSGSYDLNFLTLIFYKMGKLEKEIFKVLDFLMTSKLSLGLIALALVLIADQIQGFIVQGPFIGHKIAHQMTELGAGPSNPNKVRVCSFLRMCWC